MYNTHIWSLLAEQLKHFRIAPVVVDCGRREGPEGSHPEEVRGRRISLLLDGSVTLLLCLFAVYRLGFPYFWTQFFRQVMGRRNHRSSRHAPSAGHESQRRVERPH